MTQNNALRNPEGLPLTHDAYAFIQSAYRSAITNLSKLSGSKVILSGVTDNGSSVTDGWILHYGELLPFAGGPKQHTYVVAEGNGTEQFENSNVGTVYNNRYARFGNGGTPFSELIRLENMNALTQPQSGIKALNPLIERSGSYWFGDVGGNDAYYTIPLSPFINQPYIVTGSLRSHGGNWNADNDVIWMVRDLRVDSFTVLLREVSSSVQNLSFDYAIILL